MQIHTYVNFAQIAHGVLNSLSDIVSALSTLAGSGAAIEQSLSKSLMYSVSSIASKANVGTQVVFGLANVILDSIELSKAQNAAQRNIFATQLAFDSASLVATGVGIGASVAGAATVSAFVGGGRCDICRACRRRHRISICLFCCGCQS